MKNGCENLKICFAAGTLGSGGAEQQLFYMVKTLMERDARPRVLSLTQGERWEQPIRDLGAPVIWVGERPGKGYRLRRIVSELRRDRPDVIQSAHFYVNSYATAAGRLLKIRDLGAIRNDAHHDVQANGPFLGRICLKWPRTLVANSRNAIRNAVAMGVSEKRIFFLPNVIDLRLFPVPNFESPSDNTNTIRLLTVGRLVPFKRTHWFLRMIADFISQGVPVEGAIVGDGPERATLESLASDLGLTPNQAQFLGHTQNVGPLLSKADLFVFASESEGTPNAVMEAMASGLPVVTTRAGDVADLVDSGRAGIVVERDDEPGLRNAVLRLIRNPQERHEMSRNARAAIEREWSLDRMATRLEDLYGCRK